MTPGAPAWPFMPCTNQDNPILENTHTHTHTLKVTYMQLPLVHSCDNLVVGENVCVCVCVCVCIYKCVD